MGGDCCGENLKKEVDVVDNLHDQEFAAVGEALGHPFPSDNLDVNKNHNSEDTAHQDADKNDQDENESATDQNYYVVH